MSLVNAIGMRKYDVDVVHLHDLRTSLYQNLKWARSHFNVHISGKV